MDKNFEQFLTGSLGQWLGLIQAAKEKIFWGITRLSYDCI